MLGRLVVSLEVLPMCDVTSLQSSDGRAVLRKCASFSFGGRSLLRTTSSLLALGRGLFPLQLVHFKEFGCKIWAGVTQSLVLRVGLGMCTFLCRKEKSPGVSQVARLPTF